MKNVIGYKSNWGKDFLNSQSITKEDLLNSKIELCTGVVVGENKMIIDNCEKDIMLEMIMNNPMSISDYEEETGIVTIKYENPIPENIYREIFPGDDEVELIYI